MPRTAFFHVLILTETGWTSSRVFEKLTAAKRYAKWCAQRWDTAIYEGGAGGLKVAEYPKGA